MKFMETDKIELKERISDSLPKEIESFLNTGGIMQEQKDQMYTLSRLYFGDKYDTINNIIYLVFIGNSDVFKKHNAGHRRG